MPSEYASASEKPRALDTGPPRPTMMDERMGIIGNTHGVNARPRPSSMKRPITSAVLPDFSAFDTSPASSGLAASPTWAAALCGAAPDIAADKADTAEPPDTRADGDHA